MKGEAREIGFDVVAPKIKCDDAKCPFHGGDGVKLRGRVFTGTVVSDKMHRSAIVQWSGQTYVPKYERHKKRSTKVTVHSPPCVNAREGDEVKIMGCRPISKSKNFIIIQNLGKVRGYEERKEALEESKFKEKKKEPKTVEEINAEDNDKKAEVNADTPKAEEKKEINEEKKEEFE